MTVLSAALVAVLLFVAIAVAAPPERMPAVSLLHKMDEGQIDLARHCGPPQFMVDIRFYNTFGHEDDDGYKAVALSRTLASRPFFVVIYDDESKGDSEAMGYADFNEDGMVDQKERLVTWDDHKRLLCEAHKRLTANRI